MLISYTIFVSVIFHVNYIKRSSFSLTLGSAIFLRLLQSMNYFDFLFSEWVYIFPLFLEDCLYQGSVHFSVFTFLASWESVDWSQFLCLHSLQCLLDWTCRKCYVLYWRNSCKRYIFWVLSILLDSEIIKQGCLCSGILKISYLSFTENFYCIFMSYKIKPFNRS